jgi:hypothetical protein
MTDATQTMEFVDTPICGQLRGWHLWMVIAVATVTCASGVFGGLSGVGPV